MCVWVYCVVYNYYYVLTINIHNDKVKGNKQFFFCTSDFGVFPSVASELLLTTRL